MYMTTQQLLLLEWGVGTAHATSMFMSNSMLLWWTIDSVTLPLVIKPKFVKEALQWISERKAQVRSYVN